MEITWKPSKVDRERVSQLCLGMVVEKEYERILIGDCDAIRNRLEGQKTSGVLFDQVRPFGTFILMLNDSNEETWNKALSCLLEGREILDKSNLERIIVKKDPKEYEREAMEILSEEFDSDDLVSRFVAMKIWYGYWDIRGTKKTLDLNLFESEMNTLIHQYRSQKVFLEEGSDFTSKHPVFKYSDNLGFSDKISSIYTSLGEDNLECIVVDRSLFPIKKYYADRLKNWKKVIMRCKMCGRLFIADNRSCKYCNDGCKKSARDKSLVRRSETGDTAEVDQMCRTANAYWSNRRAKIRKSPEWTADEVHAYEDAMKQFQKEKKDKRRQHKEGKITLSELKNWLAEQSIEAEKALIAIKVTQR